MLHHKSKATVYGALAQAAANPHSRILHMSGKAVDAASAWKWLIRNKVEDFTYNFQTREVTHKDGGWVRFCHCETDLASFSGYQISHLWVDELVNATHKLGLACRIRSVKKSEMKDPMGIYDHNGACQTY